MKKLVIFLIGAPFLSCATLNKTATKVKTEGTLQWEQNKQLLNTLSLFKITRDTGILEEEVLFWPKGVIKYSSANGFEGEVEKISLRSKNQRKQVQIQTQESMLLRKSELKAKQAESAVHKIQLKAKSSTRFYAIGIVVLAFLGSFIYVVYKKKFG